MKKPVNRSKKTNKMKVKTDFFKTAILNNHAVYLSENPSIMLQKKIKDFFEEAMREYYSSYDYFTSEEETWNIQSDLAEKLHDELVYTLIPDDDYQDIKELMFEFCMLEAMACSKFKCFEITELFLEKQKSSITFPAAVTIICICKKIAIKDCKNESMANQVGRFLYNQVLSAYYRLDTPADNCFAELVSIGSSRPFYEEDCERAKVSTSFACPPESAEIYPAINAAFVAAHKELIQSIQDKNENDADADTDASAKSI